jgi:hypothetical protein
MEFCCAILLHAEANVFPMNLQIALDHPMLSVEPPAMEKKCVRPPAAAVGARHVPLRELDRAADQIGTARESDTARLGVSFEEFAVGETGNGNDSWWR